MSNSYHDVPSPLGPPAIYPGAFKRPRVEGQTFQERVEQLELERQKRKEHERRRKERTRELKRQFGQDASFAARVQANRIAKDQERREQAEQKQSEASKRAPKQVVRSSPKSNEQHHPETVETSPKPKDKKRGVKSFFANLKLKITKSFRKQEKST
jgi:hypothetical protein